MEAINKLIEAEIEKQVQEKMTTFIEYFSRTYDVPMKVLLRDYQKAAGTPDIKSLQCLGVNSGNKKRCKMCAGPNGYCKKHLDQYRPPVRPTSTQSVTSVKHTHTIPPLFRSDCPACIKNKNKPKENTLIDI